MILNLPHTWDQSVFMAYTWPTRGLLISNIGDRRFLHAWRKKPAKGIACAIFNLKKREIECKLVYYGPGRCGKTTNLEQVFKTYKKQISGEMVSINTEGDRTLFFDFLPFDIGQIKGYDIKIQLYTVPGQVKYNATRKLVLRGVDGVVFVADSQTEKMDENIESLQNLKDKIRHVLDAELNHPTEQMFKRYLEQRT